MRRLCTIAIFTLAFSNEALADRPTSPDLQCEIFASFAELAMTGRQSGMSLSSTFEIIDSRNLREELKAIYREIAIRAHSGPSYSSPSVVARVVSDFRSEIHVICLRDVNMRQLFDN